MNTNRNMLASDELRQQLDQAQTTALIVGAIGLALSLGAWLFWPVHFYPAYLVGFLFWLGISLGCIGITMLHYLTGGSWGLVIRRPLEAGAVTVALMALAFLPVALGIKSLYPWAGAPSIAPEAASGNHAYLNETFFFLRAAIYFAVWIAMALVWTGLSARQDAMTDHAPSLRLQGLSGPGAVVLFLTGTFSAIDWGMSLEPRWPSTIYGALVIVGDALATMAFMIAVSSLLARTRPMAEIATPGRLNDLGNLLLAFVMLWAYMSFCQFLIIWSGNLADEIPWYLRRTRGGWQWVALALVVFQFFGPFFFLLFRENKRQPSLLLRVAFSVLALRWVELVWLVIPASSDPASPQIRWIEVPIALVATAGIGGLWLAVLIGRLKRLPLVPLNDPYLNEAFEHAGG
jgi:hypothetical protein